MIQPGTTIGSSISPDVLEYLDLLFDALYSTIQQQIKYFKKGKLVSAEYWTYFIDTSCDTNASVMDLCNTPCLNKILDYFKEVFVYVGAEGFGVM